MLALAKLLGFEIGPGIEPGLVKVRLALSSPHGTAPSPMRVHGENR